MDTIYVLNRDGRPLMPMHSWGRVQRFLKSGRASVVSSLPFTIRLKKQIEDPELDRCILGIDPGRTNIGLCVTDGKGKPLFASVLETRNKEIPDLMRDRKQARQASRRGERKRRQRRAIHFDKSGETAMTEYWRVLPGTKKAVCQKHIRGQESKFMHRRRPKGWRTPTAEQLYRTHLNAVAKIEKLLPIADIVIEMNRFDFAKMENPGIRNWEYQRGRLFGFKNVQEAVIARQNGKCLLCGRPIEHVHHVRPRSQGGSDHIDNLAGLCCACHQKVHTDPAAKARLASEAKKRLKKYGALSVINQIMPALLDELAYRYLLWITTGWETAKTRRGCGLPEKEKDDGTHYIDAWCIAVSIMENRLYVPDSRDLDDVFHLMRQFRRHDRQKVEATKARSYYLDGRLVAKNRRPRTGQADGKDPKPALSEWRQDHEKDVARLTVRKSTRSYNDLKRVLPGAEVLCDEKRYVVKGKHNDRWIALDAADHTLEKAQSRFTLLHHNTGIVFV